METDKERQKKFLDYQYRNALENLIKEYEKYIQMLKNHKNRFKT